MADVFVSYARSDKARVAPLVAAIEAKGWSVWWDPEITPGQEFDDQIDAEIDAAKAVLVVWSPVSVASRWVRGEAREAAERGILVPVRFEQARLPMDVRAIHTTDLDDWNEDPASAPAQEFLRALATMVARSQAAQSAKAGAVAAADRGGGLRESQGGAIGGAGDRGESTGAAGRPGDRAQQQRDGKEGQGDDTCAATSRTSASPSKRGRRASASASSRRTSAWASLRSPTT